MFDGDVNGSRRIGKLILLYSNIHLRNVYYSDARKLCALQPHSPNAKRSPTKALKSTKNIIFGPMFRKHFEAIIIKIARFVLGEQFSGFSIKVIHLVSVSGF